MNKDFIKVKWETNCNKINLSKGLAQPQIINTNDPLLFLCVRLLYNGGLVTW